MVKIYVGAAFNPVEVIVDPSKSVNQVFKEAGVAIPAGSIVTWNTRRLGDNELDKPLNTLGELAEDDAIIFSQKLNGAK